MELVDNGLIVQNASDSNVCSGEEPTGLILGDGTGSVLLPLRPMELLAINGRIQSIMDSLFWFKRCNYFNYALTDI